MSIEESSKLSYTFKTINIDDSLEFKIILDVLPALVVVFVQLITRLFAPPGEIMVRFCQAQAQLSLNCFTMFLLGNMYMASVVSPCHCKLKACFKHECLGALCNLQAYFLSFVAATEITILTLMGPSGFSVQSSKHLASGP